MKLSATIGLLAILLGAPPAAGAPLCTPPTDAAAPLPPVRLAEVERRYIALLDGVDPTVSSSVYQAQPQGMPLVHAVFAWGDAAMRGRILARTARLVEGLPTLEELAAPDIIQSLTRGLEQSGSLGSRARQAFIGLPVTIDGLTPPAARADAPRHIFPMRQDDGIRVASGPAQQFAYLVSTLVRLAAVSPPAQGEGAEWRQDLDTLYRFVADDTLRFYWREAPAWHWAGPFPNMRARLLARLDGEAWIEKPRYYAGLLDYEVHTFAAAADLITARHANPALGTAEDEDALLRDIRELGMRALRARIDDGGDGSRFLYDKNIWREHPTYAHVLCNPNEPPNAPCGPPQTTAQDVSHAQRWPWWLRSLELSSPAGSEDRRTVERWQRGVARQLGAKVFSFDADGRPWMTNFVDGSDGWYRFAETPARPWGHPPSSLTGDAMRAGSWSLLAPFDPTLARAQRRFCEVIRSTDPDDVVFRTARYGPNSVVPRPHGVTPRDIYGPGSFPALTCEVFASFGCF